MYSTNVKIFSVLNNLFIVLILILCIDSCLSIKCWDCRSDADSKCADPFDNSTFAMTDCDQVTAMDHIHDSDDFRTDKSTLCRKIRQKVNGVWKYYRSCAFLGEAGIKGDERFCLMRTGTYNIFMEYCTCKSKDGCNTSSYTFISKLLLFIIICCHILW